MNYSMIRILMIGNAFEYYDFFLCSFFVSIISPSFFPSSDPFASLLAGFCFVGVGFIARPFGAFIFGYLGDKYGRKYALTKTLFLMAFSTFLIGVIPPYEKIGLYAPLLLIVLRFVQGFAIGGEVNGSAIFGLEITQSSKNGFIGALLNSSAGIGAIFATSLGFLLINEILPHWTWRLLFYLGGAGAFIGIVVRKSLEDFLPKQISNMPFIEMIQKYRLSFIRTIGIGFFLYCSFYILVGCIMPMQHASEQITKTEMILIDGCLVVFGTMISPILGLLSDKIGLRKVMLFGALGQILIATPLFLFVASGNLTEILIASIFLMFFAQTFIAPSNGYLNTLFPPECRFTGISFGICLGVAFSGCITPILCSQLFMISNIAPSLFLIGSGLVGIIALQPFSTPSYTTPSF